VNQQELEEYKSFLWEKFHYIEEVEKAENSLHEFLKQAWPVFEPEVFIDGWHLHAIAEHLEALMKRQIKKLLVNIPPRLGKTSLMSICLTPWQWIHKPTERFVYASHSNKISLKDSVACRRLIQSEWYQGRWGDRVQILKDQNTKGRFDNMEGGYRITTSMRSTVTGEGGSVKVCLPYDTMIKTDQGDLLIGEIVYDRIPCKVLSYNEDYNNYYDRILPSQHYVEYKEIEEYEINGEKEIIEIELEDRKIQCTEDHLIFVKDYGWLEAGKLQPGHVLWTI
jgi:hypothetical protein